MFVHVDRAAVRVRYAAVLLLLLPAGCASVAPVPGAEPPVVATQAISPQPATAPAAPPTTPAVVKPAATPVTPATPPAAPRGAAPSVPDTPPVAAPTASAARLTPDLNALEARLKALFAVPSFGQDEEALKKDLTAVIALQGLPCGQIVAVEEQAETDFAVSCTDGNRYRVYLNAAGRVVVEKRM